MLEETEGATDEDLIETETITIDVHYNKYDI